MFRSQIIKASASARQIRFNSNKSMADKVKDAAQAFTAEGKIGSKFTSKGEVGGKVDKEVGGAFSKDGAVGKQFEKDGAIGGLGQKVAEGVKEMAEDAKKST